MGIYVFFGVIILCCFVISTVLNPFLLHCYRTQKKTPQLKFYRLLTATDLITNSAFAIFHGYYFLSQDFPQDTNTDIYLVSLISAVIVCAFGCFSQILASCFALTRTIAVARPFYRVRYNLVMAYVFIYAFIMTSSMGIKNLLQYYYKVEHSIWFKVALICFGLTLTHTIMGVIVSGFAVYHLKKHTVVSSSSSTSGFTSINSVTQPSVLYPSAFHPVSPKKQSTTTYLDPSTVSNDSNGDMRKSSSTVLSASTLNLINTKSPTSPIFNLSSVVKLKVKSHRALPTFNTGVIIANGNMTDEHVKEPRYSATTQPTVQPNNPKSKSNRLKGSITILLMNLPYVFVIMSGISLYAKGPYAYELHLLILPMMTSAYNPIVIISRTTRYREKLRKLLRLEPK